MLRICLASIASLALVATVAWGLSHLAARRAGNQALAAHQTRILRLEALANRWRDTGTSPADLALAEDARRTLDRLRDLYRQEEKLWSYYDALEESAAIRAGYVADRVELERRLSGQRAALERLESQLDRLRPQDAAPGIAFTR